MFQHEYTKHCYCFTHVALLFFQCNELCLHSEVKISDSLITDELFLAASLNTGNQITTLRCNTTLQELTLISNNTMTKNTVNFPQYLWCE